MRIRSEVAVRLIHSLDNEHSFGEVTKRWIQTVEWTSRPSEGIRTAQMQCAACGRMVGFRIYSTRSAKWRKARLALFAVALVAVAFLVEAYDVDGLFEGPGGIALIMAVPVVLPLAAFSLIESGVAWDRRRRVKGHGFIPPAISAAIKEPRKSDFPSQQTILFDD